MKITKYAQSCFLIETKGKKILIDPGNLCKESPEAWKGIDILLLTHKHSDHTHPETIKKIKLNNPQMIIYSNEEVKGILKKENIDSELLRTGDVKKIDGIKIEAIRAMHGFHPAMKGTSHYPESNNGYMIDDGNARLYDAGDTIYFENSLKADVVLVPICGNAVVMEPKIAAMFAQQINPKLTIPMHYSNPKYPTTTTDFEEAANELGLKYKILKDGESVEVTQ